MIAQRIAQTLRHFFELHNREERDRSGTDVHQNDAAETLGNALALMFNPIGVGKHDDIENVLYQGRKVLKQILATEIEVLGKTGDTASKLWLDLLAALEQVMICLRAIAKAFPETIGAERECTGAS